MSVEAEKVLKSALTLSEEERAEMIDRLLESLQPSESRFDEIWAQEAEDRITAFEAGRMAAIPVDEVFAELSRE